MTLQEEIASAFRLHRSGDLVTAASLYEMILGRDPEQVDALQLLGVLRQQQGQFTRAVELCEKAVALRPGEASNHLNLAEAYRAARPLRAGRRPLPHRAALGTTTPRHIITWGWPYKLRAGLVRPLITSRSPCRSVPILARHTATSEPPYACWEWPSRRSLISAGPSSSIPSLPPLGRGSASACWKPVVLTRHWLIAAWPPGSSPVFPRHTTGSAKPPRLGRFQEAIASYAEALRLNPELAQTHANIGIACARMAVFKNPYPGSAARPSSTRIPAIPGILHGRSDRS